MNEEHLKKKNRTDERNAFAILAIVIFISDDTFLFGTNENFNFILLKYTIYFFTTIFLLFKVRANTFLRLSRANIMLYVFFGSIFVSMFLNLDFSGGSIYFLWLILVAFLLTQVFSSKTIADNYSKIMFFLCCTSILIVLAATFIPVSLSIFPITTNYAGVDFINLYVTGIFADFNEIRNTGIFREPGVFMVYIIFALLFQFFFNKKVNFLKVIIFISALALTYSTAAYIIIAVLLVAYFLKTGSAFKSKIIIGSLSLLFLSFILNNEELYAKVFSKIEANKINEGSSLARQASVFINLEIFSDNIISGVGIKKYSDSFTSYSAKIIGLPLASSNNTNTITTILAVHGILCGIIFCLIALFLAKKLAKSFLLIPLIFVIIIFLFSNEDFRFSLLCFTMLFWGVKNDKVGSFQPKFEKSIKI